LVSLFLVPKLLLGNEVVAQALLGHLTAESEIIIPPNYFAKRDFASRGFGNQGLTPNLLLYAKGGFAKSFLIVPL
jgi:hypothetical protein